MEWACSPGKIIYKRVDVLKKAVLFALTAILTLSLLNCKGAEKQKFNAYYFDWFDTASTVTGYEYTEEDFKKVTSEIEALFEKYHKLYNIYIRYEGINSATHINDAAGVIFSAEVDGKLVTYSSKNTLGGYDNRYIQHAGNKISNQLGLSSGMCSGSYNADTSCIEIEKTYNLIDD